MNAFRIGFLVAMSIKHIDAGRARSHSRGIVVSR